MVIFFSKALNALFALLDQDKDEHVTFEEYMIAMATFARGTKEQKAICTQQ